MNPGNPLSVPSGESLIPSPEGFRVKVLEEQVASLRIR